MTDSAPVDLDIGISRVGNSRLSAAMVVAPDACRLHTRRYMNCKATFGEYDPEDCLPESERVTECLVRV